MTRTTNLNLNLNFNLNNDDDDDDPSNATIGDENDEEGKTVVHKILSQAKGE
jgi:hypothetical protein